MTVTSNPSKFHRDETPPSSMNTGGNRLLTILELDVKSAIRRLTLFGVALVVTVSSLPKSDKPVDHRALLLIPLQFSLVMSLPIVLDLIMTRTIFVLESDFIRRFIVVVVVVPNALIYLSVVAEQSIRLIVYYQYLLIFLVLVSKLHNFLSTEKYVTLFHIRRVFGLVALSMVFAFLRSVADCGNIIQGSGAWRIVTLLVAVLAHLMSLYQIRHWLQDKQRLATIMQQVGRGKEVFFATVMILFLLFFIVLSDLLNINNDLFFFSENSKSLVIVEWFFVGIVLVKSTLHSYQQHKKIFDTSVSSDCSSGISTVVISLQSICTLSNIISRFLESTRIQSKDDEINFPRDSHPTQHVVHGPRVVGFESQRANCHGSAR
jgi:hypothetical protein